MKRLCRILFNTLTAISLLLAIATAGLWVQSDTRHDQGGHLRTFEKPEILSNTQRVIWFRSGGGVIDISYEFLSAPQAFALTKGDGWYFMAGAERRGYSTFRMWRFKLEWDSSDNRLWIQLPHWFALLLLSIVPTLRLVRLGISRRQFRPGHCPACGYDIRANPAKCWECGHEPAPATAAKRDGHTP